MNFNKDTFTNLEYRVLKSQSQTKTKERRITASAFVNSGYLT